MKVRGNRECNECGREWSYYRTGDISCPDCGSLHSVGADEERALHTASAATLELTPIRNALDEEPFDRLADRAVDRCRTFTRGYGFVSGGDLQSLDDVYLAAVELQYVASELGRRLDVTDDEEWYFTELLRADEGERPDPEEVPATLRAVRGLAYAEAVDTYRSDVRAYLEENPDPATSSAVEQLGKHVKRVRALDGDVTPRESETLLEAARSLGRYLVEGDESALAEAEDRLARLV